MALLANAVDMSNHGGPLTAEEAQCFRNSGIDTNVVATGPGVYGQYSAQQAQETLAAGIKLESYHYLEWNRDPEDWVEAGKAAMPNQWSKVGRCWLNIEDTNYGTMPLTNRINYVDAALAAMDAWNKPVGIWTASWYWPQHMGNTDRYKSRQLANSYYDEATDVDGLPYGGWTRESVALEQFGGTRQICGQSVDVCYLYKSVTQPAPTTPTFDEMLLLSIWGADTEEALPWATRVANAQYRMAQAVHTGGRTIGARLANHEATAHLLLPAVVRIEQP